MIKMTKVIFALTVCLVLITGVFTGCQQDSSEGSEMQEAVDSLRDDQEVLREEIDRLSMKIETLDTTKELLLRLVDEQVTILSGELGDDYVILPIYHLDINTYDIRVQYYTMVQAEADIEEKVQHLAEKLSMYSFDGLPIELLGIETDDSDQQIAVINLIDPEDRIRTHTGKTWAGLYFQGSSGGNATVTKLLETFLQEEYAGEWVEGVKFLYNGDETNQFEHIGELLGQAYYRGM